MVALITGASSGIGRDIARELSRYGYDLILVARREERLKELQQEIKTNCEVFAADLTMESECLRLCNFVSQKKVDILVNNAGFGLYGAFDQTDLLREQEMISLNICAVQTLTKFFVRKFLCQGSGIILNVASSAGFMPGPYMATYYATKAYVLRLSQAINEEISRKNKKISISVLCPGPVDTEFNSVASVRFGLKGLGSETVAKIAVRDMLKRKKVIVPGFLMKCAHFFSKILPDTILVKCAAHFQKKKGHDEK